MQNLALYLIVGISVFVVLLNLVATYVVFDTYFKVKQRRLYQTLFIWLVPVVGASMAIFLNREDYFAQKKMRQVGNHPTISDTYAASLARKSSGHGGR